MTNTRDVLTGFLTLLGRSLIAATGAVLATGAGILFLVLFAVDLTSGRSNPYLGVLAFLVLPAVFVLGLLLIPIGAWRVRSRQGEPSVQRTFLEDPVIRRRLALVGVATLMNIAILCAASFRAVEVMDTREFCGQTCHSVMAPEATAAEFAPHARVLCVSCHVGPGAAGFFRAKLNGVSQLAHLATGTYHRPIPIPIEGASPARGVCLDCHALAHFRGERMRVIRGFAADETTTPSTTVLMLKIGGLPPDSGPRRGIHWHIFPENVVEYQAADRQRAVITRVRVRAVTGEAREYVSGSVPDPARGSTPDKGESGESIWHRMDCVDCHNRPAHTFELPGRAVDAALAAEQLDRSLPWIKKHALEVLTRDYPDRTTALAEIPGRIVGFYTGRPQGPVKEAGRILREIYSRNVFPEMRIGWGTYPNHIGHTDFPGCFRCHDGEHKSADGRAITGDCGACHTLLAVEEPAPEILKALYPDSGAPEP